MCMYPKVSTKEQYSLWLGEAIGWLKRIELFSSSVVSEVRGRNCLVSGNPIQTFASNCDCIMAREMHLY